jgi:hypothetical protein
MEADCPSVALSEIFVSLCGGTLDDDALSEIACRNVHEKRED